MFNSYQINKTKGFTKAFTNTFVLILIIVVLVLASGIVVLLVSKNQQTLENPKLLEENTLTYTTWAYNGQEWLPSSTAPKCPDPLELITPVNLEIVNSILYPGQIRGGDYKVHGGFGFESTSSEIEVILPMDATLFRASRYIENGEIQYLLDFVNECGIMFRFDHLRGLTRFFQEIVSDLPPAKENDSSTTNFSSNIIYEAGTFIATEVGFKNTNNFFIDFGVYDLRSQNVVSKNARWAKDHESIKELAYYGVCWLDLLSNQDRELVKTLPSRDLNGSNKQSDYCDNT